MKKIFNYLMVANVFLGGFVLIHSPFEFYLGYIFVLLFLVVFIGSYGKFYVNRSFLIILAVISISSLVNVFLGNNTLYFFLRQISGILISSVAYYLLIRLNDFKVDKLFRVYLLFSVIVAGIGILQEVSFLIGLKEGYDYSYLITKWWISPFSAFGLLRVNSIFMEPSHFALSMTPAVFVSLESIITHQANYLSKSSSLLIILCFLLTFSAIAYIAFLISLALIIIDIKKRKHLVFIFLIPLFAFLVYSFVPEIRMRVNDTVYLVIGKRTVKSANLSTYSLASNAFVASKSFSQSPFFGYGLGSHPLTYEKVIKPDMLGAWYKPGGFGLNKKEAGSLLIRLISETGLFGLIIVFYFIFKKRIKNSDDKNLQVLNNGIFIMFIIQLIRQGHYFYNGLFMFVWIYYFSYKIYSDKNDLPIDEAALKSNVLPASN